MKRTLKVAAIIIVMTITSIVWAQSPPPAPSPAPDKRVAVYSFELKREGYYNSDLEKYLRGLLEAKADQHGFTLLARKENYQSIREEKGLEEIDPTTKTPKNQLYGATAIIELVGQISVFETSSHYSFGGYSLNLGDKIKIICRVVGKVIDVRTGQMRVVSVAIQKSDTGRVSGGDRSNSYEIKFHDNNSLRGQLVDKATEEATENIILQLKDKIPSQNSWPTPPPPAQK